MISVIVSVRTRSETNLREHWSARAKRRAGQREVVTLVLRGPLQGVSWLEPLSVRPETKKRSKANVEPIRAIVRVELTRIAPRALDDDNLRGALKAPRDAVAALLGVDDRDPRVGWDYGQARGKPNEYAVGIQIRPVAVLTWTVDPPELTANVG